MPYEKIVSIIQESTSEDWIYSCGLKRLLCKKNVHISLVKEDDKDLELPEMDDKLRNAYEKKVGDVVTYRLMYDNILIEPLRFILIEQDKTFVPCPYFYKLSRFGGVMITTIERVMGLIINPDKNKADYYGYLESLHIYVDDEARVAHNKEVIAQ